MSADHTLASSMLQAMKQPIPPEVDRATLGRITIRGELVLESGTHIGASRDTLEIGGIDNLIVRDPLTEEPYLPGSSLKGKLRSILEKDLVGCMEPDGEQPRVTFNRTMSGGRDLILRRHECCCADLARHCAVCRVFGSSGKSTGKEDDEHLRHQENPKDPKPATNFPAKLIVYDAFLTEKSRADMDALTTELPYAEWKSENTLDRVTAAAVPRQMERAARGSRFDLTFTYRIESEGRVLDPDVTADLYNLLTALSQLQEEGIGGSVSRGYGAVSIQGLRFSYTQKVSVGNKNGKVKRIRKDRVPNLELADAADWLPWLVDRNAPSSVRQGVTPMCEALRTRVANLTDLNEASRTALLAHLEIIAERLDTLGQDGEGAPSLEPQNHRRRGELLLDLHVAAEAVAEQAERLVQSLAGPTAQELNGQLQDLATLLAPVNPLTQFEDDFAVLQEIFSGDNRYEDELIQIYKRPSGTGLAEGAAGPQPPALEQMEGGDEHIQGEAGDAPAGGGHPTI